jgi:hypothetical protein
MSPRRAWPQPRSRCCVSWCSEPRRISPSRTITPTALAASWAAIWGLYATYTWTAGPGLSTLQAVRFYVPALGAISLLGAWLLVRVPRRQPLAAIATFAVAAMLFGLGAQAFHDMGKFPFGHRPGGTVGVAPGPGAKIAGPDGG